ncbi:MAG: hypothetical protein QOH57_2717 [Mycobacterium sp.]|jgi:hypothetical protein|nr:hypothetical protein [Mycobacterium sp.]
MRSPQACRRIFASSVIVFGVSLALIPSASADPNDASDPDAPGPPPGPGTVAPSSFVPGSADTNPAAVEACGQFRAAMNYAATNYEDFAYATAGNGNAVNYGDPNVDYSNAAGRAALKEAAGVAFSAAGTPGLQPEVAQPMQAWAMDAAKLVLIMGIRGGGDSLNSAATDLNTESRKVQVACAAAGTRA